MLKERSLLGLTSSRLCRCVSVWTFPNRRALAGSLIQELWLAHPQQEGSLHVLWIQKPGSRHPWADLSSMTWNNNLNEMLNICMKKRTPSWIPFYLRETLTWERQSPCWNEAACGWGRTETLLSACPASRTPSTAAGPRPTGGALAAHGSVPQMAAPPPLRTRASASEGSRPLPGWETQNLPEIFARIFLHSILG